MVIYMKIYLIRHGETDWNVQGRLQGTEDIELNENGRNQAKICGQALKEDHFAIIVTSPLKRATESAEIIAEEVGIVEMIIEKGIIERDFGRVSGLTPMEREEFYQSGQPDEKEPWDDLCKRLMECVKHYAETYYPSNLIMISHGASINAILSILSEGEAGTGKTWLKNTCINILDYEEGKFKIEVFNVSPEEYIELKSTQR